MRPRICSTDHSPIAEAMEADRRQDRLKTIAVSPSQRGRERKSAATHSTPAATSHVRTEPLYPMPIATLRLGRTMPISIELHARTVVGQRLRFRPFEEEVPNGGEVAWPAGQFVRKHGQPHHLQNHDREEDPCQRLKTLIAMKQRRARRRARMRWHRARTRQA